VCTRTVGAARLIDAYLLIDSGVCVPSSAAIGVAHVPARRNHVRLVAARGRERGARCGPARGALRRRLLSASPAFVPDLWVAWNEASSPPTARPRLEGRWALVRAPESPWCRGDV